MREQRERQTAANGGERSTEKKRKEKKKKKKREEKKTTRDPVRPVRTFERLTSLVSFSSFFLSLSSPQQSYTRIRETGYIFLSDPKRMNSLLVSHTFTTFTTFTLLLSLSPLRYSTKSRQSTVSVCVCLVVFFLDWIKFNKID